MLTLLIFATDIQCNARSRVILCNLFCTETDALWTFCIYVYGSIEQLPHIGDNTGSCTIIAIPPIKGFC